MTLWNFQNDGINVNYENTQNMTKQIPTNFYH